MFRNSNDDVVSHRGLYFACSITDCPAQPSEKKEKQIGLEILKKTRTKEGRQKEKVGIHFKICGCLKFVAFFFFAAFSILCQKIMEKFVTL